MKTKLNLLSMAAAAVLGVFAAVPSHAALDAAGAAHLASLRDTPAAAGTLIYRGAVFAQRAPGTAPLFTYERRVADAAEGLASAHITRDASGEVVIAEEARFTPDYALQRFEATNRQQGFSGSVLISQHGRHLEYRLNRNGLLRTAAEDVSAPVVSGPSLHGFIVHHWDALAQGERLAVRMIVIDKMRSYGFIIRRAAEADGRTAFSVTPSHLLLRLALAPLTVTFDSTRRQVIRYDGRVPPQREENGRWVALDARVDYTMHAAAYR